MDYTQSQWTIKGLVISNCKVINTSENNTISTVMRLHMCEIGLQVIVDEILYLEEFGIEILV